MNTPMAADTRRDSGKWVRILLLVCAMAVAFAMGASVVLTTPLSFDGAINGQAAMNVLEQGRYGLGRTEFHDFDHRVQTGPTVVLPTALAFYLLGVGNSVAQLANLVYFVIFFLVAALYAFRHAGPAGALLAILLLIQTPDLGPLGLGFYGEVPALFFFLAALLLLDRLENRPRIRSAAAVGILLGLAILTKIVMLIPVSAVGLVVLVVSVTRRSVMLRYWAALALGVAFPLAAFEAVKLAVLRPRIWVDWWAVMVLRVGGQGLPVGMADTPGIVSKASTHLAILSPIVGVAPWAVILMVVAPTLLLISIRRSERLAEESWTLIPVSIVSLWLAASSFLCWWLLLTPTSRAWPRRVLIGLLLQELLISIVLVRAIQWAARHWRDRGRTSFGRRGWEAGVLAALLLLSIGSLLAHNLPRIEWRTEVSRQRLDIETVAETIRTRAPDAVFYGVGWYRAPVLALLTGREIKDFNRFPVQRYGKHLRNTYFVVDNHLASHKPQEVQKILARSVHHTVVRSGDCALYDLEKVLPYLPIPEPDTTGDLAAVIRPKQDGYRFARGLGSEAPAGRYSDAVAAFLLERGDYGCLLVDLWPSSDVAGRPILEVRVDHEKVRYAKLFAGRPWKGLIVLGEDADPDTPGSLVELWMFVHRKPRRFSLWSSDKNTFVVREVGFVPCPEPDQGHADGR